MMLDAIAPGFTILEFTPTDRNCETMSVGAEDRAFVEACRGRLAGQMEITMSKYKSPPGHEQATIEGLKDLVLVVSQRQTRMDNRLTDKIETNATCSTIAILIAVLSLVLSAVSFILLIIGEAQCPT